MPIEVVQGGIWEVGWLKTEKIYQNFAWKDIFVFKALPITATIPIIDKGTACLFLFCDQRARMVDLYNYCPNFFGSFEAAKTFQQMDDYK